MKALAILSVLALSLMQGTIDFKPKVGQKLTYASSTNFQIAGNDASVAVDLETEVKKSDDKIIELLVKWSNLKVEIGGQEIPAQASDETIELAPEGQPRKVRGGIEGADAAQLFLITHFIPPTAKELTVGMKYTVTIPEVKDEVPAYKYEGEYVGKEIVDGKTLHKFKATGTMTATDGLSTKQTILVREDGTISKVEAEFTGMDVPVANAKADGKATLTLKS